MVESNHIDYWSLVQPCPTVAFFPIPLPATISSMAAAAAAVVSCRFIPKPPPETCPTHARTTVSSAARILRGGAASARASSLGPAGPAASLAVGSVASEFSGHRLLPWSLIAAPSSSRAKKGVVTMVRPWFLFGSKNEVFFSLLRLECMEMMSSCSNV